MLCAACAGRETERENLNRSVCCRRYGSRHLRQSALALRLTPDDPFLLVFSRATHPPRDANPWYTASLYVRMVRSQMTESLY